MCVHDVRDGARKLRDEEMRFVATAQEMTRANGLVDHEHELALRAIGRGDVDAIACVTQEESEALVTLGLTDVELHDFSGMPQNERLFFDDERKPRRGERTQESQ